MNGIVYYNDLCTWTRYTDMMDTCFIGDYSYTEDKMHIQTNEQTFREALDFACVEAYHGLDVFHPSYQPFPIPPGPPLNLQVLFVETAAELKWMEPERLDAIGKRSFLGLLLVCLPLK